MKVLVIYDSYYGHTDQFAKAIAQGAESVDGATVAIQKVTETVLDDLVAADAIIVGCPTHMGTSSWQLKKLIDDAFSTAWMKGLLINKVGGVFSTAGSGGAGGAELAMIGILSNLAQNGMLLVTHPRTSEGYKPDGMHWGPVWATGADKEPRDENVAGAKSYGQHVAEVTKRLLA